MVCVACSLFKHALRVLYNQSLQTANNFLACYIIFKRTSQSYLHPKISKSMNMQLKVH